MPGPARVGFTVSKKVGTAVERNRVRRRLRELVKHAPLFCARTATMCSSDGALRSDAASIQCSTISNPR